MHICTPLTDLQIGFCIDTCHCNRHEHIGHGYIGEAGFRRILNHPKLRSKAFILETPNDNEGDEARNIETLKKLCRKSSTTLNRSN
jgi:endonuclease IV